MPSNPLHTGARLPTVTSQIPNDLRLFIDRVRDAIGGTGLNQIVTVRQLVDANIATFYSRNLGAGQSTGGIASSFTGSIGLNQITGVDAPTAPTGLTTSGALGNVILEWDEPVYGGHSHTEIWAAAKATPSSPDPTIADAVLVGMAPGITWSHNIGAGADRWYWVRHVNILGAESAYNDTDGTLGQTGVDPTYLLTLLTGEITESQLYQDLSDRIDLVDGPVSLSGSVNARLLAEANARTVAVQAEASARATADGIIQAKYTVKIDNAGHLTGYGLISTANNSTPISEFGIRADNFWVAPPSVARTTAPTTGLYVGYVWLDTSVTPNVTKYYTGSAWVTTPQTLPFIVRTSPTTINGVAVPAGVYIAEAFIQNGTITNAKIANAAIDNAKIANAAITEAKISNAAVTNAKIANAAVTNAKIANLDAGKINTGFLNAARIQAGTITGDKISTSSGLFTVDGSGTITAVNATVTSLNLVGTNNFSVKSATTGARMELTNTGLRIYDASNVLRVNLGLL